MSSYAVLAVRHKLDITKDITENETNTRIEMTTNSEFFQNLFLTKKEKKNNTIYEIIMTIIAITTFIASLYIKQLILEEKPFMSDVISVQVCFLMLFIWIILLCILKPILTFFEKKSITKINDIKKLFLLKV